MVGKYAEGISEPARDKLVAMAEAASVNVLWLATGEGEMERGAVNWVDAIGEPGEVFKAMKSADSKEPQGEFVLIPRYEVSASAGGGTVIHSEQIVDYLSFKSDWIKNGLGLSVENLALINVKGDSMEPTLSNEDLILVDLRTFKVEDNAVYVLLFNGVLLVKRIQRKLDGSVIVASDNKIYEPEMVSGDMLETLNVVGRVVWCGRRM